MEIGLHHRAILKPPESQEEIAMARSFRTEESYEAEHRTRDLLPAFLRERGFTNIEDKRKRFGSTESQVLHAIDNSGKAVSLWVRLCWRRGGSRGSRTNYSAAQLRARVNNGDWVGTLTKKMKSAKAEGTTHLLLIQRENTRIVYAAAIPIDSVVEIWKTQRDVSADLIKHGKMGRRKKNHAMNGSSPTIWLQDDRAPEVPAALWGYKGVRDLAKLPIVEATRSSNPDWTRDELILALNLYLKHRPNPPDKASKEIIELSKTLQRLGQRLFAPSERAASFRNANGAYMKLMNFRRLDPEYTSGGKKGLTQGAKGEEEVWTEFANDPARCRATAEAIIAAVDDPEAGGPETDITQDIEEAAEGRLLTRKHLARERNRKLVEAKRRQTLKKLGKLECEVCKFDFAARYGSRGAGFIECHHTKPVATLTEGHKTHINDLALVCANCHRMIHHSKPWFTLEAIRAILEP